jgi:serine/threonine-protein kinase HipA
MKPANEHRCLACGGALAPEDAAAYHARCSRELFERSTPPVIDFGMDAIEEIARREVNQRIAVSGVQRKLSLDLAPAEHGTPSRLTFVGLWGRFVLKPPSPEYPEMPELEHATMRLASIAGIATARHGLVRLASGELAYVARRFDRLADGGKLALEDMCQLTGKLTEDKYRSSMEQVGNALLRWSSNPILDATRLLDVALFSFLTGNADMHLKNFSLLTDEGGMIGLSPAYDLLATALLLPEDREESALSINGKRARLQRADFVALGRHLQIADKAIDATFDRMHRVLPELLEAIEASFLASATRARFATLVIDRHDRLASN